MSANSSKHDKSGVFSENIELKQAIDEGLDVNTLL
jgi:hypothetical protein